MKIFRALPTGLYVCFNKVESSRIMMTGRHIETENMELKMGLSRDHGISCTIFYFFSPGTRLVVADSKNLAKNIERKSCLFAFETDYI